MKTLTMLMMAVLVICSVSVFAQDTTKVMTEKNVNTCPMHPGEKMDKNGMCPKCGMNMKSSGMEKMGMMKNYACPMHPDVTADKPGKCSKCGMDLVETNKSKMTNTCPMHPGEKMDKNGMCSKCGMNMRPSGKNKMKMGNIKSYTCPMHPDVTGDKPGKCPKCGMDLVEKKNMKN